MTKTIAINAGSSSLKWQLYQMPEEKVLAKGLIERIGLKDSISTVKFDGRSEQQILDIENESFKPIRSIKPFASTFSSGIKYNCHFKLELPALIEIVFVIT